MDLIWKVFIQYCICVFATIVFTRGDLYSVLIDMNTNSSLISCSDSSLIRIENITVQTGECDNKPCMLNVIDYNAIRMKCNNLNSCVLNLSLTSKCISEYGYFALSYTCKEVDTFEEKLCTFQQNLCNWTQLTGVDDFNWTRRKGPTQTSLTGPNVDHTFNNNTGVYIYIEADHNSNKSTMTARLTSRKMKSDRPKCLTFWYHMYGANIKQLNVYRNITANYSALIWSRTGNQNDLWKPARIDLHQLNTSFYIVIEGVCGNKNEIYGDIAVDDIAVLNNPCNGENHYTAQTCLNIDSKLEITDCPSKQLVDFNISVDTNLSVEEIPRCQSVIDWYLDDIMTACNSTDSNFCHIEWLNNTEMMRSCFNINKKLLIQYSCQDVPDKTAETSTIINVPDKTTQSSDTFTIIGFTVGIICGFMFVIGLTALVLSLIRRFKAVERNSGYDNNMDVLPRNNDISSYSTLTIGHASNNDGYTDLLPSNDTNAPTYSSIGTGHPLNNASNIDEYIEILP